MRILHSRKLVFVSKPRCGSTSIRNMLTRLCVDGDVICNVPDHEKNLHPHMSAPSIIEYLRYNGYNPDEYTIFTVTRHPMDMLWSYYKYFQPDRNGRYTYSDDYDPASPVDFESWLLLGGIGTIGCTQKYLPAFVKPGDFTPLSLEAHTHDRSGECRVDRWFKLEDASVWQSWLNKELDLDLRVQNVNQSRSEPTPKFSIAAINRIVEMFPLECRHYRIEGCDND